MLVALATGCAARTITLEAPAQFLPPPTIPTRIADTTYWRMIQQFSEPSGYFSSDNFVSNEGEAQYVIPELSSQTPQGGVYLGVGPEQNFTYIAAFRPRIAFITDIRRQNLIEHLMYKALFELSSDRVDFLSRLWSRERPTRLTALSSPDTIVALFEAVPPDAELYVRNIATIFDVLVHRHGFALSADDSASLRYVYSAFYLFGPSVNYSSRPNAGSPLFSPRTRVSGTVSSLAISDSARRVADSLVRLGLPVLIKGDSNRVSVNNYPPTGASIFANGLMPTFRDLMVEDDGRGVQRGWLATEESFRVLKDFQARNLLVPIVGDFGGPKALRAIGAYLSERNVGVNLFYVSNVEQYLFQGGGDAWRRFYANVATLPLDTGAAFIRSASNTRTILPRNPRSRMAQMTSSIAHVVSAYETGMLSSYAQVIDMRRR